MIEKYIINVQEFKEIVEKNTFVQELLKKFKDNEVDYKNKINKIPWHKLSEIVITLLLMEKKFFNLFEEKIFWKKSGYDCLFLQMEEKNKKKYIRLVIGEVKSSEKIEKVIGNKLNIAFNDIVNNMNSTSNERKIDIHSINDSIFKDVESNTNLKEKIKSFFEIKKQTKYMTDLFVKDLDYIQTKKITKIIVIGTINKSYIDLTTSNNMDIFEKINIAQLIDENVTYEEIKNIIKNSIK